MSDHEHTTKLPGRPTIAVDIASARRWVSRVMTKVNMNAATEAVLQAAIDSLRQLEAEALK